MSGPRRAGPGARIGRVRIGRSSWIRFLALVVLLVSSLAVLRFSPLADWLTRERLLDWLEAFRSHPAAPLLFVAVFALACLFGAPIVPLVLAGGAAVGAFAGAALSLAAVLAAATGTWVMVRQLGYAFVRDLVGDRLKRVERLVSRRGFWAMVRLRFVPIPFFVTNTSIALLGVPLGRYLASTAVAMVPVLLVWSAFASALVETADATRAAAVRNLVVIFVLLVALSFLPPRLGAWLRARRLRALRAARAERSSERRDPT
ncbi:MAG TPA: VTT domain-containing protein [Thermoanaerobaculia bacterium]|nr:VTT domain-containing protein [Thermoanaerobaculia bacterium]